jgi:hypothetical protein
MVVIAGAGLGYLAAHAEENIRGKYEWGWCCSKMSRTDCRAILPVRLPAAD